jgi:hypothetical protein
MHRLLRTHTIDCMLLNALCFHACRQVVALLYTKPNCKAQFGKSVDALWRLSCLKASVQTVEDPSDQLFNTCSCSHPVQETEEPLEQLLAVISAIFLLVVRQQKPSRSVIDHLVGISQCPSRWHCYIAAQALSNYCESQHTAPQCLLVPSLAASSMRATLISDS